MIGGGLVTERYEENEQKAKEAEANARLAEAQAKEEAAKQKLRDQKRKGREKIASSFAKLPKMVKIVLLGATIVVIVALAAILPGVFSSSKGVTVSEVSLKEAVAISKLSTAEFTYEGIAEKRNENGDVAYHIYYKAAANSSIDMAAIDFSIDEAKKTIIPILPPVVIDSPVIDESSLEYLPNGVQIDLREVLDICKADMQGEASGNSNLLQAAESNLRSTVEALLMPIIGNSGYSIEWEDSAYTGTKGDGNETD